MTKKMKRSLLWMCCMLFVFTTMVHAGNNLLMNGYFESGDLTGYDVSGTSVVVSDNGNNAPGSYAIEFSASEYFYTHPLDSSMIKYHMPAEPGKTYSLSWEHKTNASETGAAYVSLRFWNSCGGLINQIGGNLIVNSGGSWVSYPRISAVAPAGTAYLDVFITGEYTPIQDYAIRVDNIFVCQEDNLIGNGNFELGTLRDWGASNISSIVADVAAPSETGAYAAEIPVGSQYIYTNPDGARIPISAGESLDVSWDYLVNANNNYYAQIRYWNSSGSHTGGQTVFYDPDTVWKTDSFASSIAPAGTADFDIVFQTSAATTGAMRVDNVSAVKSVPAPQISPPHQILIDNHDFEDGLNDWLYSAGVTVNSSESYEYGSQCAQIYRGSGGAGVDFRSSVYAVDNNDTFSISFSYKTEPSTTGFIHAYFRQYDSGDNPLGQFQWNLPPTNNQWFKIGPVFAATDPNTAGVDMQFLASNGYGGDPDGTFLVDNVRVINSTKNGDYDSDCEVDCDDLVLLAGEWLDTASGYDFDGDGKVNLNDYAVLALNWLTEFVPGCEICYEQNKLSYGFVPPTHLYRMETSYKSGEELVLIQTLQGILAQTKPEIFIDEGVRNHMWLVDMVDNYGITYETNNSTGWYLDHFKDRLTGYILYDFADKPSMNAATSLAGIFRAVAVDEGLESVAMAYGLTMVQDVRGKDDTWVWDNYGDQFTHNAIINQNPDERIPLRDWGPAIKAYTFWNGDYSDYPAFNAMNDNVPIYGAWVGLDEHDAISFYGDYGLFTVPSDWVFNLSTYAGMANYSPEITFQQEIRGNVYTPESNVHYVTFLLSDMDNLCPMIDTFPIDSNYYASSYRGDFAMGWGMPTALTEVGPMVPAWYYREATDKDGFVLPLSGTGVMFPSEYPSPMLPDYCQQLEPYMEQLDLRVVHIIDTVESFSGYETTANEFMNIDDTTGILYIDYHDYDHWEGQIEWFSGKPLVTARYKMWDGGGGYNPTSVAAAINALPTTPNNENGYTFVIMHAWSYGMSDIKTVVDNLDSDVRVVNPEEFIEQLYLHNVGP